MFQDITFLGPQKKNFIKPTSKAKFKEKEKRVRDAKKALAVEQKIIEVEKLEVEVVTVKKTDQVKEEGMKEILSFFINVHDYRNYYIQETHKKQKRGLVHQSEPVEEVEHISFTEFLNPAEFQEIKGSMDDLNFGELCFQFLNPDDKSVMDRPVLLEEAEKVFEDILTVTGQGSIPRSQVTKQKKAFILAFLQLKDYVEETIYDEDGEVVQKKESKFVSAYDALERLKKIQKSAMLLSGKKRHDDLSGEDLELLQTDVKYEDFVEQYIKEKEDRVPYTQQQYLTALSKVRLKDREVLEKQQKRYAKGGFLTQKFNDDQSDWDWICNDSKPGDFLTLIRITLMTKLAMDGHMYVRSFLSTDGKFIFVILKSKLDSVKKFAEQIQVNKQYELGYADLFSLEPTDEQQRPLRLKGYLRDPEYLSAKRELLDDTKDSQDIQEKKTSLERIESKAQKIYQQAMKWGEQELRAQVVTKQRKVDKWLKKVVRDMHIDQVHERVELVDDMDVDREVWEAYFLYLEFLDDFLSRVNAVSEHEEIIQNKGFIYKLILQKSMDDPNRLYWDFNGNVLLSWLKDDHKILRNVWDRMGVPPVAPYGSYFNASQKECMWRKYQTNEKQVRSEFQNMEKMRLTHTLIQQHIDVMKLVEQKHVVNYFPLHDIYQLKGTSKIPHVKPLIDLQLISADKVDGGQKRLNDLYISLKDGAEATDFNNESLVDASSFHFLHPWEIPIQGLRDYFGEKVLIKLYQKVALYFRFIQFYTRQLFTLCIVSLICQVVIDKSTLAGRQGFLVLWAVIITVWSTTFLRFWLQQQGIFQLQFGQTNLIQQEGTRPAFNGKFKRSIITDNLNEQEYPGWLYKMKMIFSFVVTLLILVLVIASCVAVFYLKERQLRLNQTNDFVFKVIPSLVSALVIFFFNYVYAHISDDLNDYENHKYVTSYENAFILKNFAFIFVNTYKQYILVSFSSMFIISFLDQAFPWLNICLQTDKTNDCFVYLQNQMISIFILNFIQNIPEMIAPCCHILIRSGDRKMDDTPVLHEFLEIDTFVEEQSILEAYQSNFEIDGTVADYIELVIQYSFLNLFGLAFPLSYFLAFLNNILEIQVDKIKLIYFFQRPFPNSAGDIGNWFQILELVNFLGICSNAGLVAFTSGALPADTAMESFILLLIILLFAKFLTNYFIGGRNLSATQVIKRHENAVIRVLRGIGSSSAGYRPGLAKMKIDCVDYSKVQVDKYKVAEHIIKGPNVILLEDKK